jgi:hypothetical protein
VISWQIENEYDWNGADLTSTTRANVLRTLARASVEDAIDVPLFTCETMDKEFRDDPFLRAHVFNTTNKYPGYDMKPLIEAIEAVAKYQPETFRGVSELQGGWFSQVGGTLSGEQGLNAAQITQLTLTAIERGCTSINYYMFYGGSNFGLCAARMQTQTYDYNAPLREWGAEEDRYFAVKAIGQMINDYGAQIINSQPVNVTIVGDHQDVSIFMRQSYDGSIFYFIRNANRNEARSATVKLQWGNEQEREFRYDLDPFGAKVLYVPAGVTDLTRGEWLPKPVARTAVLAAAPVAVPLRPVSVAREEPADDWVSLPTGQHLEAVGVFDQRYVHYRVKFDLSQIDLESPLALRVHSSGGGAIVSRINGNEVVADKDGFIELQNVSRPGSNLAEILFENLGCPNFGPEIEQTQGISQIDLVHRDDRERGSVLEHLQVARNTSVEKDPMAADQHRRFLVRCTLDFAEPPKSVPLKLHLDAHANAFVTLNGHLLGRYWNAGPQRDFWLPECWLNFGPGAKNLVELQAIPTADQPVARLIEGAEVRAYVQ